MLGFFYTLYYWMHPMVEVPLLRRLRIYSLGRCSVRWVANILVPLYYLLSPKSRFVVDKQSDIVVTLTSFPLRINKLWIVVESLLHQHYRPKEIWLWLSKVQFPLEEASLPKRLLSFKERGLRIVFVDGDIRSHKKYYYSLLQHPQQAIVTVDDDIFYHPQLFQQLHAEHQKYPHDVIAAYVHQMTYCNGTVRPYTQWNFHSPTNQHIFFGSGGGTYFPSGAFYKDICDIANAQATCPVADDIWLNAQVRLAGTHIRRLPNKKPCRFIEVMRFKNLNLSDANVEFGNKNDIQLHNVIDLYLQNEGRNPFEKC